MKHLFCFGIGFTATRLARKLSAEGWKISGTCRNAQKCEELKKENISAYVFDDLREENLEGVTHILHSIQPNESGDIVINKHLPIIKRIKTLEWVGYLSTTGVYGDHKGEWVDENTPVNPPNERSRFRADAENSWLDSGLPVHIFRLSGIYGPGRSAIDDVRAGEARRIYKEGQVFSRIHVDDITQTLMSSIKNPNRGEIYNCADDMPAPQHEVIEYACKLLNVPPPPLIDFKKAELSEMARSFYMNNRRVSNKKIKQELKIKLLYPSYKEGLLSLINE